MTNRYNHPHLEDLPGEMLDFERGKLREWVYDKRPYVVFEIGGGSGGGSTINIAHGLKTLKENGYCKDVKFYSCDAGHSRAHMSASYFSTHPDYKDFVHVFHEYSHHFINRLAIKDGIIPDFVFFDGPEEAEENLTDFKTIESLVPIGTLFAAHDWETKKRAYDGATSVKNLLIRPYLEENKNWKELEKLSGFSNEWPNKDGDVHSVGLVLYEKVNTGIKLT